MSDYIIEIVERIIEELEVDFDLVMEVVMDYLEGTTTKEYEEFMENHHFRVDVISKLIKNNK